MAARFWALLGFIAATSGPAEASAGVSAVHKVIQLLTDMQEQARRMKKDEEVEFATFEQFCQDKTSSKDREVKDGNKLIEDLSADIEGLESDITKLGTKIDELRNSIETSEAGLKAATAQREKDHASHTQQIQDFAESVDALERAIDALQKQNKDHSQAEEMLLQLSVSSVLPEKAQRTVAAFLEMRRMGGDYLTRDAPEAHAYEFQSGSILELLHKLHDEFAEKRSQVEKEEMNSKHACDLMMQDLQDSIEGAKADTHDATVDLEEKRALAADTKKRLGLATADRDEDVVYLKDLRAECEEKAKSFTEKQDLREEEIKAIGEAIKVLGSPDVLGSAQEHLSSAFTQLPGQARGVARALAQLRAAATGGHRSPADGASGRLARFLRSEGLRLHSRRLGMLAERLSTSVEPFTKVKTLIYDLIQQLLHEAAGESEHKGWCDAELGTNKITREKLGDDIEGLTAKIDEGEAAIAQIAERLSLLAQEVSELSTAMAQATAIRDDERAKNVQTIKDAVQAQKAVGAATAILKDFYAKASSATALVQVAAGGTSSGRRGPVKMGSAEWQSLANPDFKGDVGHSKGMQTFGKTYKGQQAEAGGALAMLEVIASDFATLEADTSGAEAQAESAYRDFSLQTKKSITVKERETKMLEADKSRTQAEVATDKKDLAATQDQLLAADRYYDKLKPSCVDTGLSYQERTKARDAEIQSLQEALQILSGEDPA